MTRSPNDLDRLREEYARREKRFASGDYYSDAKPANRFAVQQRQRALLALLHSGSFDLAGSRILDVGCGAGGPLAELLALGARPENLGGIDLLPYRLAAARARLPHLALGCADAQDLPFRSGAFDLAIQFTVFSSILDDRVRGNIAAEMLRILRPGGAAVWYDFWWNPTNRATSGIRPAGIRRLFPGCSIAFRRITLAPPILKRILPISRTLALALERLSVFNSHYLALIVKPGETQKTDGTDHPHQE